MTTDPTAQLRTRRARNRLALPAVLIGILALAFALAGCGSSSKGSAAASAPETPASSTPATGSSGTGTSSAPASGSLSLAANPEGQLTYDTKSLSAKAGKVSIAFTNSAPLEHNLTVETSSGKIVGATPTFKGGAKTLSLNLTAGTYKFFCTVPGHRQAGMEGTLTVE